MSRLKVFFCLFFFAQWSFQLLASAPDTAKQISEVHWFSEQELQSPFEEGPNSIDTTITGQQLYDFVFRSGLFYANKGNTGHATRMLQFEPKLDPGFLLFPWELFPGYRFKHKNLRFYRPPHVFTELSYVMGSVREQLFNALHYQRFYETLYAGFDYQLVSSPGFYSQTASRNSNIYLTLDFQLPNKRYQVLGSFISNRFENEEGGGLSDHLAFEQDPNSDFVFLSEARLRMRETTVNLSHYYLARFLLSGNEGDSLVHISFLNLGQLKHDFSFRNESFVFKDPYAPVSFYEAEPFDPVSTFDSTRVTTIENSLSCSNFPIQSELNRFLLNFRIYLKHQLITIEQPLYLQSEPGEKGLGKRSSTSYSFRQNRFSQIIQGLELKSDPNRFLSGKAFAHLSLGGYNDKDLGLGGAVFLGKPGKQNKLGLQASFYQQAVPYSLSKFYGNYISWENDFHKQKIGNVRLSIQMNWMSFESNFYLLSNMAYLGPDALPLQNIGTFGFFSAGIDLKGGIGVFQNRHKILYQYSGDQQFEQYPELVSYHSLFFDFSLFKKAMDLNVGVDLFYIAPYSPMGYMPVVYQFYVQNKYKSPHVILADVFATIKVKRARFFLKARNFESLIPGLHPVYTIPFYPIPGLGMKFGVSWMFFD